MAKAMRAREAQKTMKAKKKAMKKMRRSRHEPRELFCGTRQITPTEYKYAVKKLNQVKAMLDRKIASLAARLPAVGTVEEGNSD